MEKIYTYGVLLVNPKRKRLSENLGAYGRVITRIEKGHKEIR
jgi:hypothetical protein